MEQALQQLQRLHQSKIAHERERRAGPRLMIAGLIGGEPTGALLGYARVSKGISDGMVLDLGVV